MMRAAPLLISAICFTALLPRTEATALFPAMKKRLAMAQQKAETAALPASIPALPEVSDVLAGAVSAEHAAVPASVPDPIDVGADGFPKLPEVSDILGGAVKALKTVDAQAKAIEIRTLNAQKRMKGKLARQKVAFEHQLKGQETQNLAVAQEIQKIQSEVAELETRNTVSRTKSHALQKSNKMLRNEMHELGKKLGVARSFAFKTVFSTDDSKAPTLNVLKGNEEQKQVVQAKEAEDDDSDDSDDDEDVPEKASKGALLLSKGKGQVTATSLLQTAAHAQKAASSSDELPSSDEISPDGNPDDLLAKLTQDVAHLAKQEKQSEKTLKEIFIRDFRAGAGRHKSLLAKQAVATKQRTDAQALEQRLQKAVSHLNATHLQLIRSLHGVAKFMKKLAHVADAKETDVPKLMGDLPTKVTLGKHVEQMPKLSFRQRVIY